MKDIDRVSLTYNDSQRPGRVVLRVDGSYRGAGYLDLSATEAVTLADRLLMAVRNEGYVLTAKRETR